MIIQQNVWYLLIVNSSGIITILVMYWVSIMSFVDSDIEAIRFLIEMS
ncbi:MAG: hypothetical protein KJ963_01685 [Bacteroidetes bacterium]|nr:hypothetical protein [Bacteroidota bacterium]MBU1423596.1 hypothetical protein [Bacteroidota bacterium]MBU2635788.1 hypothetical protein [Bacteroidota bacterium]